MVAWVTWGLQIFVISAKYDHRGPPPLGLFSFDSAGSRAGGSRESWGSDPFEADPLVDSDKKIREAEKRRLQFRKGKINVAGNIFDIDGPCKHEVEECRR